MEGWVKGERRRGGRGHAGKEEAAEKARNELSEGGTAEFRRRGLRELDAAIRRAFSIEFN